MHKLFPPQSPNTIFLIMLLQIYSIDINKERDEVFSR
jgi:hypothetical protein